MVVQHIDRAAERTWKHRFAQTLFEIFCEGGLDRVAALADAYAHADAQFLVRGFKTPEEEARSALLWIQANEAHPHADNTDEAAHTSHTKNQHNGASHIVAAEIKSQE